jgi:hypothetical protein
MQYVRFMSLQAFRKFGVDCSNGLEVRAMQVIQDGCGGHLEFC